MDQALAPEMARYIDEPTLADLRAAAKLTSREAAAAIGKTQPRISQIEKEGTRDIDILEALAAAYGVEVSIVKDANNRVRHR